MKRSYNLDIILVILLALISLACLSIKGSSKYFAVVALYILLTFFLPGYSLFSALSSKNTRLAKKIAMGVLLSIFILLLFISTLQYTDLHFKTLLQTLAGITIFFAIIAYLRIFIASKSTKNRYIICEDCGGYYKLEDGESLDDFGACHCGGKLKYAENNFMSKLKAPERKKLHGDEEKGSKGPKTTPNKYIKCENCGGYYRLKKDESLEDFGACACGGELKYAPNYFKPESVKKNSRSRKLSGSLPLMAISNSKLGKLLKRGSDSKFGKFPRDILLIFSLILLAVIAVSIPSISSTALRTIFVLPLLIFLSGYSFTKAVLPRLSGFKLILSSFIFSVLITFSLGLLFSSSALKVPPVTCILVLAFITVALMIFSFIRKPKLSVDAIKYPKTHESHLKSFKLKTDTKFTFDYTNSRFMPSDILLVFLITVLCVIFVLTPVLNDTPIRVVLGTLLILFAPGYSLIAALFPKKDGLDGIERTSLSFGLSIAVTALLGLMLNYTPFGIQLTPVLISVSIFTAVISIVAYIRRFKLPDNERLNIEFKKHYEDIVSSFKAESGTSKILSIILLVSIILAVSGTIYVITTPKQGETFTEFYILGPNGKASDYPLNLTAGQRGNVTVGVVNHEYADVNYKIVVKFNNYTLSENNITLSNNEKYEGIATFTPSSSRQNQKVEFLLYKLPDNNTVYRSLHLWINKG